MPGKKRVSEREKFCQRVATELHRIQCNWNHVSGCSWEYEHWDFSKNHAAHKQKKRYLEKARKMVMKFNNAKSTLMAVLKSL